MNMVPDVVARGLKYLCAAYYECVGVFLFRFKIEPFRVLAATADMDL